MRLHKRRGIDEGLLALRLVSGGLMAGHGAQKLFGSFGGPGLAGTSGWMESMGLKPGRTWAAMAGGSEFASGVLTAIGLLNPLGPIAMIGPMATAWALVHPKPPIWAQSGGAELPLINIAIATALALTGPGRYSVDESLDIEVPTWITVATGVGVVAGWVATMSSHSPAPPAEPHADGDEAGAA
ncbi:MAG: DoxX family protein [Herpetosiphon sp.]